MDEDNGVGRVECGMWAWVEQERVIGGKWGQLQLNNNTKIRDNT